MAFQPTRELPLQGVLLAARDRQRGLGIAPSLMHGLEPLEDLRPVIGRRGAARERRAETPVHPADRQRRVGDKVVEQGGDEVVTERLDTR
jgi:hypothetical protein